MKVTLDTSILAYVEGASGIEQRDFVFWDEVILSVASRAGCRLLVSEDLQDGFTWGGVTVVNPFASPRHALLASLLGEGDAYE